MVGLALREEGKLFNLEYSNLQKNYVILIILISLTLSAEASNPLHNLTLWSIEGKKLAHDFIEFNNLRTGIDLLGGPFEYKDYTISLDGYLDSGGIVRFQYNQRNGYAGVYDTFEVDTIYRLDGFKKDELESVLFDVSRIDVGKDITPAHIQDIQKSFPKPEFLLRFRTWEAEDPGWPSIASIDNEGKLSLKKAPYHNISKIRLKTPEIIEVTLNKHLLDSLTNLFSSDLRLQKIKDTWTTDNPKSTKKVNDYTGHDILVFGQPKKSEILSFIKILERISIIQTITSMELFRGENLDNDELYVSSGQADLNTRFHSFIFDRPTHRILYKKFEYGWLPILTVSIDSGGTRPNTDDGNEFFFYESSISKSIKSVNKKFTWDKYIQRELSKTLSKKDHEQIYEILKRLKIDGNYKRKWLLMMDKTDTVEAIDYFPPSFLTGILNLGRQTISHGVNSTITIVRKGDKWILSWGDSTSIF